MGERIEFIHGTLRSERRQVIREYRGQHVRVEFGRERWVSGFIQTVGVAAVLLRTTAHAEGMTSVGAGADGYYLLDHITAFIVVPEPDPVHGPFPLPDDPAEEVA